MSGVGKGSTFAATLAGSLIVSGVALAQTTGAEAGDPLGMLQTGIAGEQSGARALLRGRRLSEVRLEDVANRALDGNLDIQRARETHAAAGATADQAAAAFDTILDASISYTRTRSHDRAEIVTRKRTFLDFDDPAGFVIGCVFVEGVPQAGVVSDPSVGSRSIPGCFEPAQASSLLEFASAGTEPSAIPQSVTGFLGLTQPFAFGAEAAIGLTSKWNKKNSYKTELFDQILRESDPFDFGSRMPWTSNVNFRFTTPVPLAKNFGKYGSLENVAIIETKATVRQTLANRKLQRNATLQQVITGYWDLVQAYEEVKITAGHRRTLESMFERVKRLFDLGRVTNYAMFQVEADFGNIKNQEEIAWNNYLAISNALQELLDADLEEILVPSDFENTLVQGVEVDPEAAYDTALVNNPAIVIGKEDIAKAQANVLFTDNQLRPDLRLTFTFTGSQVDEAFGYESWADTITHLTSPDKTDFFIGLRYRYPLSRAAERAAHQTARVRRKQAQDRLADIRNGVTQSVSVAVNDTFSTTAQIDEAATDLELALFAYNKVLELEEKGLTTQFEILTKFRDVLTARLGLVAAQAALQRANTRLLAAQGVLDERYAR